MDLMDDKKWHLKTLGEKTSYSTNGATLPLDGGEWSEEGPNLIPHTIMNFRCTKDLNPKNAIKMHAWFKCLYNFSLRKS